MQITEYMVAAEKKKETGIVKASELRAKAQNRAEVGAREHVIQFIVNRLPTRCLLRALDLVSLIENIISHLTIFSCLISRLWLILSVDLGLLSHFSCRRAQCTKTVLENWS